MKCMESLDSPSPNNYFLYLMTTTIFYVTGWTIDKIEVYYVKHKDFFEFTKVISSDLAWWGGSAVAVITVVTWLQNNGFLPKGKPKK